MVVITNQITPQSTTIKQVDEVVGSLTGGDGLTGNGSGITGFTSYGNGTFNVNDTSVSVDFSSVTSLEDVRTVINNALALLPNNTIWFTFVGNPSAYTTVFYSKRSSQTPPPPVFPTITYEEADADLPLLLGQDWENDGQTDSTYPLTNLLDGDPSNEARKTSSSSCLHFVIDSVTFTVNDKPYDTILNTLSLYTFDNPEAIEVTLRYTDFNGDKQTMIITESLFDLGAALYYNYYSGNYTQTTAGQLYQLPDYTGQIEIDVRYSGLAIGAVIAGTKNILGCTLMESMDEPEDLSILHKTRNSQKVIARRILKNLNYKLMMEISDWYKFYDLLETFNGQVMLFTASEQEFEYDERMTKLAYAKVPTPSRFAPDWVEFDLLLQEA